jgi:hypothetical protein
MARAWGLGDGQKFEKLVVDLAFHSWLQFPLGYDILNK